MKLLLQILHGIIFGLCTSLHAVCKWIHLLITGKLAIGAGQCNTLHSPVVIVPDPLIYDQYYLSSLGLPISWDNPDISIWQNGVQVSPSDLTANTTYQVVARIWNNSTAAPVAALRVVFSYLSFGIGTQSHPISQTTVNLGVKGGPNQPAFATVAWTTPTVPGHYCIQVSLEPASDANWSNNLGQENTQVAMAHSAAVSTFELRNNTDERQAYEFRLDAFQIAEPPPCPPSQNGTFRPELVTLPARLGSLSTQPGLQPTPLPPEWQVTIMPARPVLAPKEQITVQVAIEPPASFAGMQTVNIHAFQKRIDRGDLRGCLKSQDVRPSCDIKTRTPTGRCYPVESNPDRSARRRRFRAVAWIKKRP